MDNYQTTNLDLSAFLISERLILQGLETSNGRQFVFIFAKTFALEKLVEDFYGLKALVQPQEFSLARQNLISAIVAKKGEKENV